MRFYIESLGCNKNQVDSEKIAYAMEQAGYEMINAPDFADVIIVNTCCFIENAKNEAIETIFELLSFKQTHCRKFVVAGCFAQRYPNEVVEEIPEVDLVFGVGDVSQIAQALQSGQKIWHPEYTDIQCGRHILNYPGFIYLKISEGCSNHCAFCAIPLIRGEHRSRPPLILTDELRANKTDEISEVVLIGQDTAQYGTDLSAAENVATLALKLSAQLRDSDWLRVLYMHPDHLSHDMLVELSKCKNFVPYFDIPFQSGCDEILARMGRKHNRQYYLDLIKDIRTVFPDAIIRSTFIAGFPGETDEQAKETLDFIREAQLDWAGGFTYSAEEGTPAAEMPDQIPESKKKSRLKKIIDLCESISHKRMHHYVGTTQTVLIEEQVEQEELYLGRVWMQAPEVDGITVVAGDDLEVGRMYEVEITELNNNDFYAVCK